MNQPPEFIDRLQRTLQRVFAKAWVELSIGGVIVLSVILTLTEFALSTARDAQHPWLAPIQWINFVLTTLFIVELIARNVARFAAVSGVIALVIWLTWVLLDFEHMQSGFTLPQTVY